VILAVGLIVAAAVAVFAVVEVSGANPNIEAFPAILGSVFRAPEPMLLAVAHPIVYHASWRAMKLSESAQPPRETAAQRAIQVPPKELDGSDMIPVFNQYVGFGDMVAANEVSAMLARSRKWRGCAWPAAWSLRTCENTDSTDRRGHESLDHGVTAVVALPVPVDARHEDGDRRHKGERPAVVDPGRRKMGRPRRTTSWYAASAILSPGGR